ncbi:MAG: glycoside hydrolase family 3 C-terminal domain-containing protein [Paraprevotella clara]
MLKAKLGLLDKDARLWNEGHIDLDPVEARKTAYELACQSVVMLKNDGILPLDIEGRKVALIGPNANAACCMVGDYTYQSMRFFWWGEKIDAHNPEIITLKEALGRRVGGALGYERGCEWSRPGEVKLGWGGDPRVRQLTLGLVETQDDTDWQRAIRLAEGSDVVIAALGENPALCGEARERNSIRLPGEQENLLRALIATGRPVILVMFGGRPQVIGNLADSCAAVLQAWYPGEEGGNAVADILLGNVCPSGRLSVSYPMNESRASYCYNNGEKSADVAYPFGYGLSYTDFEFSDLYVPREVKTSDEKLHISCKVKNVGARVGAEVVQLYLSPRSGQPLKPIQLKGFARVELEPGESRRVEFVLSPEQLAYYTDKGFYMIEPGRYEFMVGASSEDIRQRGLLTLTGQAVKADLRTHYLTSWK